MNNPRLPSSVNRWIVAGLTCFCGQAMALTVLVDFGNHGGGNGNPTVNPDGNGNYWNSLSNGEFQIPASSAFGSLIDTGNQATTISITTTSIWRSNGVFNGGLLSPSSALLGDFAVATATQDYWFTEAGGSPALNNESTLTIGGLDPAKTYNFRLFGTRNSDAGTRETTYTLEGSNGPFAASLITTGLNIGSDGIYDGNDDTIVSINGVAPDALGGIDLTLQAVQGNFGYLGIMEISEVPEPGSTLLVAAAGILGLARRRRSA